MKSKLDIIAVVSYSMIASTDEE